MPNIHPLIIHFPIVILIMGFLADIFGLIRNNEFAKKLGCLCLVAGTGAIGLAALTGWLGHKTVAHADSTYTLIEQHQELGFVALGLFSLLTIWRFKTNWQWPDKKSVLTMMIVLQLAGVSVMIRGAHLGGLLVFQHGVGVKPVADMVNDDHSDTMNIDDEFNKLLEEL